MSGTVTLDGKPLDGVMVQFHPQGEEGGRSAVGYTDSEGKYVLQYIGDVEGTKLGPNQVSITTVWPEAEMEPGDVEKVPAKYRGKTTTLMETVVEGDNTIDFKLESQ